MHVFDAIGHRNARLRVAIEFSALHHLEQGRTRSGIRGCLYYGCGCDSVSFELQKKKEGHWNVDGKDSTAS